ncbi:MAG: tetratricopeptide repeat protein, partial [Rubrivivax sp.]
LQLVTQHLRDQRAQMVVDNCEHLLQPAAALIHAVMKVAPKVVFITSSRVPLRLPGEQTYPVQPLPLPQASDGLDALRHNAAVQLFVQRAQEQRPGFELDDTEGPAVAELVARLEGIPLALELAAARLRSMTVADINRRLKNRFKLLTGGSSVRDARQQTLRGLVDWSYELLQPDEQAVLCRLAVFSGGFDLGAAEAVCADDDAIEADDVLDRVDSLVEKSLVGVETRGGSARYRMLETIRDYAAEKLDADGGREAVAARHCAHYFELAKQGRNGMQGPEQGRWLDRLELEQDNLRAAMAAAQAGIGGIDPLVAVKMAVALQNFWIMRGGTAEGRAAVRGLLDHPAVQALPMAQAHALYVGAALAWTQGDLAEAQAMLQRCLALRRGLDNATDVAATLSTLAVTHLSSGDAEHARSAASEAVTLFGRSGYRVGEAIARVQLGEVEAQLGHADASREQLGAALTLAREIGHPETEGEAELALGELALQAGDLAVAQHHLARSHEVCTRAGDRRGQANACWAFGRLDLHQQRHADALPRLAEALRAFDAYEMRASWAGCVEDLAALALALDQPDLAVRLLAAAQRVRDSAHQTRSPQQQLRRQALRDRLVDRLGPASVDALELEGASWGTAEAQRHALALAPGDTPRAR